MFPYPFSKIGVATLLATIGFVHANNTNTGGQLGVARTISSYTLGKGSLNTGISLKADYAWRDIRISSPEGVQKNSPILLSQNLFWGYGITNWLDGSLDLPVYQDLWDGHETTGGLGDLSIALKMEHPGLYVEAPLRIAYLMRFMVPTGTHDVGYYQRHSYHMNQDVNQEQAYTVGGLGLNPTLVWTLDFNQFPSRIPLQIHGNLGGFLKVTDSHGTGRRGQSALLGNLAAEYQFNTKWGAFVELSGEARLSQFLNGYHFINDLNNDQFRVAFGPTLKTQNGIRSSLSFDIGISDRNQARTKWAIHENNENIRYTTTNTPRMGATLTIGYAQKGADARPASGRFFAKKDTLLRIDTLKVIQRDTLQIVKNDTIVVIKNDTIRISQAQSPTTIIEYGARVFPSINFYTGSAELTESSYPTLNDIANSLANFPNVRLEVRGYTDATGSDDVNTKLSQDRAQTVVQFLVGKGIAATRLRAVGMGPSNPIADNSTVEGRVLNRRVEIKRID